MYVKGRYVVTLIRKIYETYVFRNIRFCFTDILHAPKYYPHPQLTDYSYFYLLSVRMGVTSHLQRKWRLSLCNERVGG